MTSNSCHSPVMSVSSFLPTRMASLSGRFLRLSGQILFPWMTRSGSWTCICPFFPFTVRLLAKLQALRGGQLTQTRDWTMSSFFRKALSCNAAKTSAGETGSCRSMPVKQGRDPGCNFSGSDPQSFPAFCSCPRSGPGSLSSLSCKKHSPEVSYFSCSA